MSPNAGDGHAYTQARKNSNAQKWAHLTTFERCANILGAADSPDTDLFPNCNNTGLPYEYPREAVATDSQRGPMLDRPRHRVRHGRPGLWPGRTARP